jgi:hypothetical protein
MQPTRRVVIASPTCHDVDDAYLSIKTMVVPFSTPHLLPWQQALSALPVKIGYPTWPRQALSKSLHAIRTSTFIVPSLRRTWHVAHCTTTKETRVTPPANLHPTFSSYCKQRQQETTKTTSSDSQRAEQRQRQHESGCKSHAQRNCWSMPLA